MKFLFSWKVAFILLNLILLISCSKELSRKDLKSARIPFDLGQYDGDADLYIHDSFDWNQNIAYSSGIRGNDFQVYANSADHTVQIVLENREHSSIKAGSQIEVCLTRAKPDGRAVCAKDGFSNQIVAADRDETIVKFTAEDFSQLPKLTQEDLDSSNHLALPKKTRGALDQGPVLIVAELRNSAGEDLWKVVAFPAYGEHVSGMQLGGAQKSYFQECAETLGEIPDLDFTKGNIIPIYYKGVKQTAPKYAGDCDQPALLGVGNQCHLYSRMAHISTGKGSATIAWRKYGDEYLANEKPSPNDFRFHDVNIIQTQGGKTCFFNTRLANPKYTRIIPSPWKACYGNGTCPNSAALAKSFWYAAQDVINIDCIHCHDTNKRMNSPYAQNSGVVPKEGKDEDYQFIGAEFRNAWKGGYARIEIDAEAFEQVTNLVQPPGAAAADKCTSCHYIGARDSCSAWSPQSVGAIPTDQLSAWMFDENDYTKKAWMPANHGIKSSAQYHAKYDYAITALNCCCKDVPKDYQAEGHQVWQCPPRDKNGNIMPLSCGVQPTPKPTVAPTAQPTIAPTIRPTASPTSRPTPTPIATAVPCTLTIGANLTSRCQVVD